MVLQSILLIVSDPDNVKQFERANGRRNGVAETVAECLCRFVIFRRLEATERCALARAFTARSIEKRVFVNLRQPNATSPSASPSTRTY